MPKITYITHDGEKNTVEVPTGLSVMEGALQNNRLSCQIIVSNDLDGLEVTTPVKQG